MINKLATASASGATITFALFYVMTVLIAIQPGAHIDLPRLPPITLSTTKPDTPIRPIEDKFEIPDPVTPPPLRIPESSSDAGTPISVPHPPVPKPPQEISGPGTVMNDGPLVAIVRVAPEYPPPARSRNLEGYVIVEFDVMTDGSVANVRVIESTSALFERSALKAAERFRYKAQVVEGVAQVSTGVRTMISFRLEDSH